MKKRQRFSIEVFEILGQPPATTEPRKGSFDDPTSGQNLEALGRVGALDDLGDDVRQSLFLRLAKLRSLIAAVREQLLQKRELSEQRAQNENAAIAILNVGRVNDRVKQQAYCIDENMPLLALDLLSRVVARRINRAPPLYGMFEVKC